MLTEEFQEFAQNLSTAQQRITRAMAFVKDEGVAHNWFVSTIVVLDTLKDNESPPNNEQQNGSRQQRGKRGSALTETADSELNADDFEQLSTFISSARRYMRKAMSLVTDGSETHRSIQMGINLLGSLKDDLCPIKEKKQKT